MGLVLNVTTRGYEGLDCDYSYPFSLMCRVIGCFEAMGTAVSPLYSISPTHAGFIVSCCGLLGTLLLLSFSTIDRILGSCPLCSCLDVDIIYLDRRCESHSSGSGRLRGWMHSHAVVRVLCLHPRYLFRVYDRVCTQQHSISRHVLQGCREGGTGVLTTQY